MKSIVHIASAHRASDARIFQKECRSLKRAGYDVSLIIPHDRDETVEGINIKSVPLPATGRDRLTTTLRQLYRRALEEPKDSLFHFHDGELLPWMLLLSARGRTIVYDVHEDTPNQVWHQHWIPTFAKPLVSVAYRLLERLGGWCFDGIVASMPTVTRRFPKRKTVLAHNYPLLEEYSQSKSAPYAQRAKRVTYIGGVTESRGVSQMMSAIALLSDDSVRLYLCGPFFPASLEQDIEHYRGRDRTVTTGWIGRDEMDAILADSRIGIVTLLPTVQYQRVYATKMFEYMAAGIPVIASDFPLWKQVIDKTRCGVCVNPNDPQQIADAIQSLLDQPAEAEQMGRRGQSAVMQQYNWSVEAQEIVRLYRSLGFTGSDG